MRAAFNADTVVGASHGTVLTQIVEINPIELEAILVRGLVQMVLR
jgi:hypothetical protein